MDPTQSKEDEEPIRMVDATPEDDADAASDVSIGEPPVREKLKKTSISSLPRCKQEPSMPSENLTKLSNECGLGRVGTQDQNQVHPHAHAEKDRERLTRKRSFDDLATSEEPVEIDDSRNRYPMKKSDGHVRKRSRDFSAEDASQVHNSDLKLAAAPALATTENGGGSSAVSAPASSLGVRGNAESVHPRKKRSRENVDKRAEPLSKCSSTTEAQWRRESSSTDDSTHEVLERGATDDEPLKKKHRESSEEKDDKASTCSAAKIPPTSGFANTSTISPFGSLTASGLDSGSRSASPFKSHSTPAPAPAPASTSTSGFAVSGFASLAKSASPFGTVGTPLKSFASTPLESTSQSKSSFSFSANAGFGISGSSGFGKVGSSAFGSGTGGTFGSSVGQKLTSFATSPNTLSPKKAQKPFGAPASESESGSDEEQVTKTSTPKVVQEYGKTPEKIDTRFHAQEHVTTGEEDEETVFSCRGKLYHNDGKQWKERGLGTFKLNAKKTTARMIMRTDGTLKVVLNTPVFKAMSMGEEGQEPKSKSVIFQAWEEGHLSLFTLKTGKVQEAQALYHQVAKIKELLE